MSLMVLGSLVGGEVVPKLSSAQVIPQLHLIPDPTHPGQLRAGPWGAVGRGRGEICCEHHSSHGSMDTDGGRGSSGLLRGVEVSLWRGSLTELQVNLLGTCIFTSEMFLAQGLIPKL